MFFCLSPPLVVFLWDDNNELFLYVTNKQPQKFLLSGLATAVATEVAVFVSV